jgi:hypothetical protein
MSQATGFSVFLGNVPQALTDQSLRTQLSPFLEQLGIEDWTCQKPREKSFAFLTFLHHRDGQSFLNKHGQQPIPGLNHRGEPKMRAQLNLLRRPVFCREGDLVVDPMLLKVLVKDAEDRKRPAPTVSEHVPVVFKTQEFCCGHYEYPKGRLTYAADIQWQALGGIAKFAKDTLIVSFPSIFGQLRGK